MPAAEFRNQPLLSIVGRPVDPAHAKRTACAVADNSQRRETELTTALDHLGHAVDGDQLLEHAVGVFAFVACHVLSGYCGVAA